MENIFVQLALVLSLSSLIGYIIHRLKLPLVLAYLLAGVFISFQFAINPQSLGIFSFLPSLGIALVLFLIGMELDLREIKSLGFPIILASVGQILITSLATFSIAGFLGFNQTQSAYLAIAMSFSSTIVVIKLLLEKREIASLYGKLALGILLIEDLAAILVLMAISVSSSVLHLGLQESLPLLTMVAKAIGLFLLTFYASKFVLEKVFDSVAKNSELLFLTAITWCFVFTSLSLFLGFSVVIGAFLAGVALASSPYHLQIQGKVKPLRDFFVTLFFVYLGTQAKFDDLASNLPIILIFTLYVLIIKPLIFLLILGAFGFRKHTLFQTSIHLTQISEFSLVILLLATGSGIVPSSLLSIMAAVLVLSMVLSSVMISFARKIYLNTSFLLPFFEHKTRMHFLESKLEEVLVDHVVLIGAHRVGGPIVKYLKKSDIPFVVMELNPEIVAKLREEGVKVIYGDVEDPEILENLQIDSAKLIISTATDMGDNEMLLDEVKRRKIKAKVVVRALDHNHGEALKTLGADYVILPEQVSGNFLVNQLKESWPNIHFKDLD